MSGSLAAAFLVALVFASTAADLQWAQEQGYRSAPLAVPRTGRAGFTLVDPARTGVIFTNHLAEATVAANRVLENGSGVALGDVDGDGWCDIYLCQLEGRNALYRNLGDWHFQDITDQAGVACAGQYSTGAAFADIDGDGDLDLLVNSIGGGTRAFLNDGKGHFTELAGTRLVRRYGSTSLALADMDGDGALDLYVTNYRTDTYRDRPKNLKVEARMIDGKLTVTPADRFVPLTARNGGVEVVELGERDFLYLNDGRGHFAPVSWTAGSFLDALGKPLTAPPLDWGLTVAFRDLNGDGLPDLYVCNDFFLSPDRVWLNQGGRGFQAPPPTALRNMSLASMSVDVADVNRDGFDDILVVDMRSRSHEKRQRQRPEMMQGLVRLPVQDPAFHPEVPRNTLFLNRGDGTYAEIAQLSGLAASEWSWSAVFLDVDLDGYEDVLIATGNTHDVQDADVIQQINSVRERETPEQRLRRFPPLLTENLAFRNQGDLTFVETGARWGFDLVGVSQGMALADLDNDGDLDVVLNYLNANASLYRNETPAARIAVRLKGASPNTHGIGAKVRVEGGPVAHQAQEIVCGGRYLSCDDTMRVFAAGSSTNDLRVVVDWRSGRQSVIEHARGNRIYEIDESGARPATVATPAPGQEEALFEDVSPLLQHQHQDQPFDDFARQPLLPRQLSGLGPGVAWGDLDGDGWEDLVIGAGRGGRLAVFRNTQRGSFARLEDGPAAQDQMGLVIWSEQTNSATVLVASANYEDATPTRSTVRELRLKPQITGKLLFELEPSAGPLALGDLEGRGALSLFVGGRVWPGRYPAAVSSKLYQQVDGAWELDKARSAALEKVGLVSGAVFSDLDGDGRAELILACEWGPVRVFAGRDGRLEEKTAELGLEKATGWWNGVTTGDFDGDGRMDIVAANWGRNSKYQAALEQPLRMYYGEFNGDGRLDLLEAYFDRESNQVVPWRDFDSVLRALPFVRATLPTYRAYGSASVEKVLGPHWANGSELRAVTLDSAVFLNRGGRFEMRSLPVEAQFAPAFGIAVSDFDGDGNDDIVLAQNFFGVDSETSRSDGGRGLLLKGDGHGNFTSVPGTRSGIKVYGEQRGCAVADFDHDGRPDLVIAQNAAETKLYRNVRATPGLRVTLRGPKGNPTGLGSSLRLQSVDGLGPAREIHGGAGYLSMNAATEILCSRSAPQAVLVRWPGGAETRTQVPEGAREVTVEVGGQSGR